MRRRDLLLAFPAALLTARVGAEESLGTEIRLQADTGEVLPRKLKEGEAKQAEEVLNRRLSLFAVETATFEFKEGELFMRVPSPKVVPQQLRMLTRRGLLELRYLEGMQTTLNPKGRYAMEVRTVQGESSVRFRDLERERYLPSEEFLRRCPLVASSADLVPGSARKMSGGALMAVRVDLDDKSTRRLERVIERPGRLVAIILDGELISINASVRRVRGKRKKGGEQEEEVDVGQLDLGGGFKTDVEADYLAVVLNSGMLPVPLKVMGTKLVAA